MSRDVWLEAILDLPTTTLCIRDVVSGEEIMAWSCEQAGFTWKRVMGDPALDDVNIVELRMRDASWSDPDGKLPAKVKKPRK